MTSWSMGKVPETSARTTYDAYTRTQKICAELRSGLVEALLQEVYASFAADMGLNSSSIREFLQFIGTRPELRAEFETWRVSTRTARRLTDGGCDTAARGNTGE